jgi:hypothetical protein
MLGTVVLPESRTILPATRVLSPAVSGQLYNKMIPIINCVTFIQALCQKASFSDYWVIPGLSTLVLRTFKFHLFTDLCASILLLFAPSQDL